MAYSTYPNLVYNYALSLGMPDNVARCIVGQSVDESGNYTSAVFKDDNNMFGMHYAGQDLATASTKHFEYDSSNGVYYPFAHYATWQNSVYDLVKWLLRRQKEGVFTIANLQTPYQYATALKSAGYFTGSTQDYANTIQGVLSNLNLQVSNTKGNESGGGGVTTLPGSGNNDAPATNSGNDNKELIVAAAAFLGIVILFGK